MGDIFNSLSENALGIFLGILAFLLGIVSELMASAITSSISSGHITVTDKKGGMVIRFILWAKKRFQTFLERWVFNSNKHVKGAFFMYRLERLNEEEYIWNYTELELDINLSNEIKGRYVDYRIQQDNLIGSVEGNYVLNQMLVLFIFGWQDAKQEGPKEMITLPNFHQVPTNLGWVVNIGDVEKRPLPVVIKREMLNFPKQLLRDPGVKHLCANLQHNIYWANFKNEME